jgi:MoaA/NifB/PqqE/SkfB family radical SAM enzyme
MITLYRENSEFGKFNKFDTNRGELSEISQKEFDKLSKTCKIFQGKEKTHTGFPRRVYFQITRNCNLECDYCFIKAESNNMHLDKEVIFRLAEYFGKQGLMEVRLTGGEPTTHPYFKDIYTKFRQENIYVSVATNAVWKKEILDYLVAQKNLWIIVSIDGNRETHNRYRKDSYDIVIKNLKKLKKKNPDIKLRINTVLTKENKNNLEHLAKLTKELKAESITLIPLRPQVRNLTIKDNMLTALEFKEVIEDMLLYKTKYGIKFSTTIETEFSNEIMKDKIFKKKSSCAAGREGTNLDFDLQNKKLIMYGCSYCPASDLNEEKSIREPFLAGEFNFNEIEDFGKIWNENSRWTIFRDLNLKSQNCHNCKELGKRCTGSCPIQNIKFDKLDRNQNIKNEIIKQMKQNAEWYCYRDIFRYNSNNQ